MKHRSRWVPPLNSVRAFETAARHQSIKSDSQAADELLVTHGAVSKQVRVLERHLRLMINRQFFLVYHPKMEKNSFNLRLMDWLRKEVQSSIAARPDLA